MKISNIRYLQREAIYYACFTKWNKSQVCKEKTCFVSTWKQERRMWNRMLVQSFNHPKWSQVWIIYMSSAIPKALFSKGVKAPAEVARLQSPSESDPSPSSRFEYLGIHVIGCRTVLRYRVPENIYQQFHSIFKKQDFLFKKDSLYWLRQFMFMQETNWKFKQIEAICIDRTKILDCIATEWSKDNKNKNNKNKLEVIKNKRKRDHKTQREALPLCFTTYSKLTDDRFA